MLFSAFCAEFILPYVGATSEVQCCSRLQPRGIIAGEVLFSKLSIFFDFGYCEHIYYPSLISSPRQTTPFDGRFTALSISFPYRYGKKKIKSGRNVTRWILEML